MEVVFLKIGNVYTRTAEKQAISTKLERFILMVGVSSSLCFKIWESLEKLGSGDTRPSHLLWSLFFLKCYTMEHVATANLHVDSKTLRQNTWKVVKQISAINNVSYVKTYFQLKSLSGFLTNLLRLNLKVGIWLRVDRVIAFIIVFFPSMEGTIPSTLKRGTNNGPQIVLFKIKMQATPKWRASYTFRRNLPISL